MRFRYRRKFAFLPRRCGGDRKTPQEWVWFRHYYAVGIVWYETAGLGDYISQIEYNHHSITTQEYIVRKLAESL